MKTDLRSELLRIVLWLHAISGGLLVFISFLSIALIVFMGVTGFPIFMKIVFATYTIVVFVVGVALLLSAFNINVHRNRAFSIVWSIPLIVAFPLGTIVAAFSLWVLTSQDTQQLYVTTPSMSSVPRLQNSSSMSNAQWLVLIILGMLVCGVFTIIGYYYFSVSSQQYITDTFSKAFPPTLQVLVTTPTRSLGLAVPPTLRVLVTTPTRVSILAVPPTITPTSTGVPTRIYLANQNVSEQGWEYTVTKVEKTKTITIGQSLSKTAQGVFVVISLTLKNVGKQNATFMIPLGFEITDTTRTLFDMDRLSSLSLASYRSLRFLESSYVPGVASPTVLVFDVNPSATGLKLHLLSSSFYVSLE